MNLPRISHRGRSVFLFAAMSLTACLAAAAPPNLVFVLSDDQRHDFLGCAGHPVVKTPNLDRLAADGVRFTDACVTTSICAASRASIFTGLLERTHGYTFGTAPLRSPLVATSYPTLLRQAGYRTGFVGKFGVNVEGSPAKEMFDSLQPLNRSPYVKTVKGQPRHVTDIAGDKAVEFVRETPQEQPFCLSISFNAAHAEDGDKADPYPAPATEANLYHDQPVDQPRLVDLFESQPEFLKRSMNRDRWFWRWDTQEKYERNVRDYYRLISALDRNVGRVLSALQETGRAENTIVIFMGDNGYYKGDRGFAGKWSHYEESLRVPLIIYDPRSASPGGQRTCDAMVLNLDIAPTLLATAGVAIPDHVQGQSLAKLVNDPAAQWERDAFLCEHLMDHPAIPKWEGIRTQRYTYARYFEQTPPFEFLHDREHDPDQRRNVAGAEEYADVLAKLRTQTDTAKADAESANEQVQASVQHGS